MFSIFFAALSQEDVQHLFDDMDEFSSRLGIEFSEFKKNTVDPIWDLRSAL